MDLINCLGNTCKTSAEKVYWKMYTEKVCACYSVKWVLCVVSFWV